MTVYCFLLLFFIAVLLQIYFVGFFFQCLSLLQIPLLIHLFSMPWLCLHIFFPVSSLQTLCRKTIQKHIIHRMAIDWLELPEALKHYCKYEWRVREQLWPEISQSTLLQQWNKAQGHILDKFEAAVTLTFVVCDNIYIKKKVHIIELVGVWF